MNSALARVENIIWCILSKSHIIWYQRGAMAKQKGVGGSDPTSFSFWFNSRRNHSEYSRWAPALVRILLVGQTRQRKFSSPTSSTKNPSFELSLASLIYVPSNPKSLIKFLSATKFFPFDLHFSPNPTPKKKQLILRPNPKP